MTITTDWVPWVVQIRRHCSAQQRHTAAQHSDALTRQLATWAQASKSLGVMLEMPLSAAEEAAVAAWLGERMAAGDAVATFLPLMYLQRGRLAEALHAYARLEASPVTGACSCAHTVAVDHSQWVEPDSAPLR